MLGRTETIHLTPNRSEFPNSLQTKRTLTWVTPTDTNGPNRTSEQDAANGRIEPIPLKNPVDWGPCCGRDVEPGLPISRRAGVLRLREELRELSEVLGGSCEVAFVTGAAGAT